MVIVLIGYMGCGKTTVGKALSKVLNFDFIDLDQFIVSQTKQSISEIFASKGEIYFRKTEAKYLNYLIEQKTNCVLALGGGTPCYGNNINLITSNNNVKSIYLNCSVSFLVDRLIKEKDCRPLIKHLENKTDLKLFIGKHLFERSKYYNNAQFKINADNNSVDDIIETILFQLI